VNHSRQYGVNNSSVKICPREKVVSTHVTLLSSATFIPI